MKKLLMLVMLSSMLFGQSICELYLESAQKDLAGMRISTSDGDVIGVRTSCEGFKFSSKMILVECKDTEIDKKGVLELRKDALKLCSSMLANK